MKRMMKYLLLVFTITLMGVQANAQVEATIAAATDISTDEATFNGSLDLDAVAEVTYYFEYSTASDFSSSTISAGGTATINGPVSELISGLTPGTRYYYRLYVEESATPTNNGVSTSSNFYTLSNVFADPIDNFVKISATTTTIDLEWDAETTNNDGYVILYRVGDTAPVPADEIVSGISPGAQSYSAGVSSAVVTGSSSDTDEITGLTAGTQYSFVIIPYNADGNAATTNYNVSNNSSTSGYTLASEPTQDADNRQYVAKTDGSISISYNAATGANGYLILYRANGSAPNANGVTDGIKHTTAADFDQATGFLYADGNGNTNPTISGLNPKTIYSFRIIAYAYVTDGGEIEETYNYRTNGGTLNNISTAAEIPGSPVSNFTKSGSTETSVAFSFDEFTTFADNGGFLVYYATGDGPIDLSGIENGVYPENQTGLPAYTLQGTDNATAVNVESLAAGTEYTFTIINYNHVTDQEPTFGYNIIGRSELTHYTLAAAASGGDVADNGNFAISNLGETSLDLSWDAVTAANGYLIVYQEGTTAIDLTDLADGLNPASQTIAGVTILDNATATTANISGLNANTAYVFQVIPYTFVNDGGAVAETYNYNKANPPFRTATTLCEAPASQAAFNMPANITSSTVDLNWAAVAGTNVKYLVVAKQGTAVDLVINSGDDYESEADLNFSAVGNEVTNANNILYAASGTSITVTGLLDETVYHFAIYAYEETDFCYAAIAAGTVDIETLAASSANTLAFNSAAATINSVSNDVSGTFITVMNFDMIDTPGADESESRLLGFTFSPGAADYFNSNGIDWTDIIADARVENTTATGNNFLTATVNPASIEIVIASGNNNNANQFGYIAPNGLVNMRLQIRLRNDITVTDIDNKNFVFALDPATITVQQGSEFDPSSATITTGNLENEIVVNASQYVFTTQPPANAIAGQDVSPAPVIEARDGNNNLDFDYANAFNITNADVIGMLNLPGAFSNGILTFPSNFRYQSSGDGTLTITEVGDAFDQSSNAVEVQPTITLAEINNGLNAGILESGTVNQAVLGFELEALGIAELNQFVIGVDQDINGLVDNVRVFESADNTFDGTDTEITSTVAYNGGAGTITFSALAENISSAASYFFIVVDVEEQVNEFDSPDLTFSITNTDLTFDISVNSIGGPISKLYSFEDGTAPEVVSITANKVLLSDSDVGADALQITITYNEEMDNGTAPTISFPVEDPTASLALSGSSAWSPGNLVYTAFFNLSDQNTTFTAIDVRAGNAVDKSGNTQLIDFDEADLFSIDTENPTAINIELNRTDLNRPNNALTLTATFSETMNTGIEPDFTVNGSSNISGSGGSWSTNTVYTITFTHDLLIEEEVTDANITVENAEDVAGNSMVSAVSPDFDINTIQSKITDINSSNANGKYNEDSGAIEITLTFDQNISVSGIPELDLNSGGTATYDSHAANQIVFRYNVGPNENAAILNVVALNLPGGAMITNTAGNEALLTLPTGANLADNKSIEIDTRSPEATISINRTMISRTERTLIITATYDEDMNTASTPSYVFSAGSNMISDNNGDWVTNRIYEISYTHDLLVEEELQDINIEVSGATDEVGNTSVEATSENFDIDTQRPRITSITSTSPNGTYGPGASINIRVIFDEDVKQIGTTPVLTMDTGGTATFDNITGGNQLNFTYTVGAVGSGENSSDLNVASISNSSNEILDLVDNPSVLALPAGANLANLKNIIVDTQPAEILSVASNTANGIYKAADVIAITLTFNETVIVTGNPELNLNTGDKAVYASGSNSTVLVFNYTVQDADNISLFDVSQLEYANVNSLVLAGGTIVDLATVPADLQLPAIGTTSLSVNANLEIDTRDPEFTIDLDLSLVSRINNTLTVTTTYDEDMNTLSSPSYSFSEGSNMIQDNVGSWQTSRIYIETFTHNLGVEEERSNVTINVTGATDVVGNTAVPNTSAGFAIDTQFPSIQSITSSTANGIYGPGAEINIKVIFDEPIQLTGAAPTLILNTGATAFYTNITNDNELNFTYTVGAVGSGENTNDLAVVSISNSATDIRDIAGNESDLTLNGSNNNLQNNTDIIIDTELPELDADPFTPSSGSLNVSQQLTFSIEFSQAVRGAGTNNIRLVDFETDAVALTLSGSTAFSNSETNKLNFESFEASLADTTVYYFEIDDGAIEDLAGNAFEGFIANNVWSFTTFGPARIDNFSPGACVGEPFTIEGKYFTGVSKIVTNLGEANEFEILTFTVLDDENISFTVPAGTEPGNISLLKISGEDGNTDDAVTTSEQPIKVGPSSAEFQFVEPNGMNPKRNEICDSNAGGSPDSKLIFVDILGSNDTDTYTLIYSINGVEQDPEFGYFSGKEILATPEAIGENEYQIISLTPDETDLASCNVAVIGDPIIIEKFERSTVEAGGNVATELGFGLIEICGVNTTFVKFNDLGAGVTTPSIQGNVESGTWVIDEGPSSNGGGFSPDFSLKEVETDQPDTITYYASFADAVRGEIILRLISDDPPIPNPCVAADDRVMIRFATTISVRLDESMNVCQEIDEDNNIVAFTAIQATLGGGANGVKWTREDTHNESGVHDGSWGFAATADATTFSEELELEEVIVYYKASPEELLAGEAILNALPTSDLSNDCAIDLGDPAAIEAATKSIQLNINPLPAPQKNQNPDVNPEIVCSGDELVRFRMNASNTGSTFIWTLSNSTLAEGLSADEINQIDGLSTGNLLIVNFREVTTESLDTLVVQELSSTGCLSVADTFFITIKPLPEVEIIYNETTSLGNNREIRLEGNFPLEGSVFSGPGVVLRNNGEYWLETRNLEPTDLTDPNDVVRVTYTYQDEDGCANSTDIVFNIYDAEAIFPNLDPDYCELVEPVLISVDTLISQGSIVTRIEGFGITSNEYVQQIIGEDTVEILQALFNPELALAQSIASQNPNPSNISIEFYIRDSSDENSPEELGGSQSVLVYPLPELGFDIPSLSYCTDDGSQFDFQRNININPLNTYSFSLDSFENPTDLPAGILSGDNINGYVFNPSLLQNYLVTLGLDFVEVHFNYAYTDGNTCENTTSFFVTVYKQPDTPELINNNVNLCVINNQPDEAVIINYDGLNPDTEIEWYNNAALVGNPVARGLSFQPQAALFNTIDELTFYVVRKNQNSESSESTTELNVLCESQATAVTFRVLDNPDFEWNRSTFGEAPIVFTGTQQASDAVSSTWVLKRKENLNDTLVTASNVFNLESPDEFIIDNFADFGAGIYVITYSIATSSGCEAFVTKEVLLLPKLAQQNSYSFDFNDSNQGWVTSSAPGSIQNSWELAIPTANSDIQSENPIWITNSDGAYNSREKSYVYSPAFDLSDVERPVVNFDLWQDVIAGTDGMILEYSVDDKRIEDPTKVWLLLGNYNGEIPSGQGWYNDNEISAEIETVNIVPQGTESNNGLKQGWSQSYSAEVPRIAAKHALAEINTPEGNAVIFRFQFGSRDNVIGPRDNGMAFDNFEIQSLNRMILVEYFGDFAEAADQIEMQVLNSGFTPNGNFTWINYRTNELDSLYQQHAADMLSRIFFYDAYNLTDKFSMDGEVQPNFTFSSTEGLNQLSNAILNASQLELTIDLGNSNSANRFDFNVSYELDENATIQELPKDTRLFAAVVYKELSGNGSSYYHVLRKILPNVNGESIGNSTRGTLSYSFEGTRLADEEELAVVAFVQDVKTGEVYQASYFDDLPLLDVGEVLASTKGLENLDVRLFPNPASNFINVSLDGIRRSDLSLQIVDLTGKSLQQIDVPIDRNQHQINTSSLKTGIYSLIIADKEGNYKVMKFAVNQ